MVVPWKAVEEEEKQQQQNRKKGRKSFCWNIDKTTRFYLPWFREESDQMRALHFTHAQSSHMISS